MLPHAVGVHPWGPPPGFHVFMPRWHRVGCAPPVPSIVPRVPVAQNCAPPQRYAARRPATSAARRNGAAGAARAADTADAAGPKNGPSASEAALLCSLAGMLADWPVSMAPATHAVRVPHCAAPVQAAAPDTTGARVFSVASAGERRARDAAEVLSGSLTALEMWHTVTCVAVASRLSCVGPACWSVVPVCQCMALHRAAWLLRELGARSWLSISHVGVHVLTAHCLSS